MKIFKLKHLKTRKNKSIEYINFLKNCDIVDYESAGLSSSFNNYVFINGKSFYFNDINVTLFFNHKINEIVIGDNWIQILIIPNEFNLLYLKLVLEIIKHNTIEKLLKYDFN